MDPKVTAVLNDLKKGKFQPVYFLQGEETYFIDLISDYIEEHAIEDSEKGFNQTIVYGKDVPMATVLTHAKRFPMMAEKQVVIVKEAQDIQDLKKESGSKLLLDYLNNPVPSTILVFCHKHKTLDKRKEVGKKVDKLAVTISAKKMYENQLPGFIKQYFLEKNVGFDEDAVVALCEYVGNDLSRLTNEINKLLMTHPKGQNVTKDEVIGHIGVSKEYNIFELQKAIISKDILLANKIVNFFEGNVRKNPIIPVVAYLFSFFSKVLIASQLPVKNDKAMASTLKVSPYAIKDYSLALRQFHMIKLMQIISLLKETDLKLKGVNRGSETDGQLFRELVHKIMH